MAGKTIKGQAWIMGDKLLQDQILLLPGGISSNNTIALIEDIWKDLTSDNGTFKYNGKNYFYWIYKMTDPEDDSNEIEVMLECPRPKDGLFGEGPFDDKLRDVLEEDVKKYYNKEYSILSTSSSEDINSYCSKFVYTLFLDAGKKLNRDTRLFPDKFPILPFDFLETKTLDNIVLK